MCKVNYVVFLLVVLLGLTRCSLSRDDGGGGWGWVAVVGGGGGVGVWGVWDGCG